MKGSSLAAGLKVVAERKARASQAKKEKRSEEDKAPTVLIGGHFHPEVHSTLLLIRADVRCRGKSLKQVLGEAINDLAAKYGKPQPYRGED